MAERVETVRLVANVSNYIAGMEAARLKTAQMAVDSEARLAQQSAAFSRLGVAAFAVGAVAAAAVGIAVVKFAQFDAAMSNVKAVTQETTENMELLRAAALDAGGRTIFTATEAANAIEELGKAGLSTADILGGALNGALSLAASGQLEVARAAEITATTLKQYNLAGDQASHVADVLSAAAGKALGSVEDLAQGLKFVGPVAASMGISLEETAGALALFADQGVIGEQAGTSLRGVLSSLTSPSAQAGKEIHDLGIDLYDAGGGFVSLTNLAGQLANAYRDKTDAERDNSLGLIFGNQQLTTARILFEQGSEAIAKYTAEVNDSGYAARVAADRLDNLKGDVEKLSGAFDNLLIQSGSGANDMLRDLVQTLTFLVDGMSDIPAPVLSAGLALGVVTAAIGLTAGAALLAVPKIVEMKAALATMGLTARGTAVSVGLVGGAIGGALLLLGVFAQMQAEAAASSDAFADSLDQTTGSITAYTRELAAKRLADLGAFDAAKKAGVGQQELLNAVIEGGPKLEAVTAKIKEYARANGELVTGPLTNTANWLGNVNTELEDGKKKWADINSATDDATDSTRSVADSMGDVASASEDAAEQITAVSDALRGFNDEQFAADDALASFKQNMIDLTDLMGEDGFTGTLDANTEEGLRNAKALRDIADSANEAAAAAYDLTGNQGDANAILSEARGRLEEVGSAFGLSGDALQQFIDKYLANPTDLTYNVQLKSLTSVRASLDQFIADYKNRVIPISAVVRRSDYPNANGGMYAYASGGIAEGIYSGGTPLYKFAEPETGWEAFISGRPGAESSNRQIWAEAGERLGMKQSMGGGSSTTTIVNNSYSFPHFLGGDKAAAAQQIQDLMNTGATNGDVSSQYRVSS